jgi:hypothetical protein
MMASQPFSHQKLFQSPFVCVRNYPFGVLHNGDRAPLVPPYRSRWQAPNANETAEWIRDTLQLVAVSRETR